MIEISTPKKDLIQFRKEVQYPKNRIESATERYIVRLDMPIETLARLVKDIQIEGCISVTSKTITLEVIKDDR